MAEIIAFVAKIFGEEDFYFNLKMQQYDTYFLRSTELINLLCFLTYHYRS